MVAGAEGMQPAAFQAWAWGRRLAVRGLRRPARLPGRGTGGGTPAGRCPAEARRLWAAAGEHASRTPPGAARALRVTAGAAAGTPGLRPEAPGGARGLAKGKGKKGRKGKRSEDAADARDGGAAAAADGAGAEEEIAWGDYEEMLDNVAEALERDLADVRGGRASPGMLDRTVVNVYGERTELRNIATVTVLSARQLSVTVYDPGTKDAIRKAIAESPLRLNPSVEGEEILVPVPEPSAETQGAMLKIVAKAAERAKVSVRNVRNAALGAVKRLASKDEQKVAGKRADALIKKWLGYIDDIAAAKEADLRVV